MSFSFFNWYSLLALYIAFTSIYAVYIYNRYYYFFYPIKDETDTDIHEKYPEFKKQEKNLFTLKRLIIGLPFAIPRVLLGFVVAIILFLYLK